MTTLPVPNDNPPPTTRIPYVHGRHLVPIRAQPRTRPNHRIDGLLAEEDHARSRIEAIDQALVDLAAERRTLLERIRDLQHELRPPLTNLRGRRRRKVSHEEALPPVAAEPTWLSGRELRAICLAFLCRLRAPTTLRTLHVLLHRAGYAVASAYPAKTLADALGYETRAGRTARTARATYHIIHRAPEPGPSPSTLPDW